MRPAIVLVDDEAIVLRSLTEELHRQFGAELHIEAAETAAEALEIVEHLAGLGQPIAAVVSDHIMPGGMNGDELLVTLHQRLPRTRKILLTGQAGVDAVANVVNVGALYRYITKPWEKDDLALTIREAVRSFTHEEEIVRQEAAVIAAHEAGRRFVPFEFVRLLGHEEIEQVSLNDHVAVELSVLFSDIRAHASLAAGTTAHGTFALINEYLAYMEPAIRHEGGFVDTFTGDGVMALFEGSADRAVRSGVAQLAALERFNRARSDRGQASLRVGIGINTGELMLGVISGGERLKPGVIGDAVNVAARIETYTKHVGASLLISEHTVAALDDPAAFTLRAIDRVRFKGKTQPLVVYEVLDGLPDAERARKMATRGDLAAGRDELLAGRPEAALRLFARGRATDPTDPVLAQHEALCQRMVAAGVPPGWDGVTQLEGK